MISYKNLRKDTRTDISFDKKNYSRYTLQLIVPPPLDPLSGGD